MMTTYEEYIQTNRSLSLEEMIALHRDITAETAKDPDALAFYDELISTATCYQSFRANWLLWNHAEKLAQDPGRTACHNSLIVKFNQLARYLKMQGKPAAWRDALGYEEDNPYNRKRLGDFACYLVFINSINAR